MNRDAKRTGKMAVAVLVASVLWALACRWACADAGPEDVADLKCDRLVLNTYYNEAGHFCFSQVLFQDWDCRGGDWDYFTRAYRIVRKGEMCPQRDWEHGGYSLRWKDGDVWRRIQAPAYTVSDTQFDPEVLEREILPKEQRRELLPR
jgi:hypothetical protein